MIEGGLKRRHVLLLSGGPAYPGLSARREEQSARKTHRQAVTQRRSGSLCLCSVMSARTWRERPEGRTGKGRTIARQTVFCIGISGWRMIRIML
jgi:hypothetical protein